MPPRKNDNAREIAALRTRISELERAKVLLERAVAQAEVSAARLRVILKTAVDGIVLIDEHGSIESFNRSAGRIFGYEEQEVLGRDVSVLMPEPYRSRHPSYIASYLATGRAKIIGIGREVIGSRRDGSVFPMELAVAEVRLPDRLLFTGIVRDISDRRAAEEAARAAQRSLLDRQTEEAQRVTRDLQKVEEQLVLQTRLAALGQVSASIAHELRSPLAAIKNAAFLLARRAPESDSRFRRYLGYINDAVSNSDHIISNLLQSVRGREPIFEEVDLGHLVREVAEHAVPSDRIEFHLDLRPTRLLVRADPNQMRQIIVNLITNAVDAIGEGGQISVTGTKDGNGTVLAVSDSGPGIPRDQRARVFEPLYSTRSQGTGLGLSICRDLIGRQGGTIEILDSEEGGAMLRLWIPARTSGA